MQSTSSVRTFRPSPPEEPKKNEKKPKKEKQPKEPKVKSTQKLKIKWLPWLIIVVLLIVSAFLFVQYQQAKDKLNANNPEVVKQQTQNVVGSVGKLIILPKDQTPTVATVVNADKLKSQTFFANAKDGDKVLVFNKTKQAILYRPSTNQLVNVSTVGIKTP